MCNTKTIQILAIYPRFKIIEDKILIFFYFYLPQFYIIYFVSILQWCLFYTFTVFKQVLCFKALHTFTLFCLDWTSLHFFYASSWNQYIRFYAWRTFAIFLAWLQAYLECLAYQHTHHDYQFQTHKILLYLRSSVLIFRK